MEEHECRVCNESDDLESNHLVEPCQCNGTMRYIHLNCLNEWIKVSGNGETCPTCRERYKDEFIVSTDDQEERCNARDMFEISFKAIIEYTFTIIGITIVFDGEVPVETIVIITIPLFIVIKLVTLFFL
jgi:E3 ubiquitin-protein ligase DOA10